jgi:glycosyltransferase involved in cell wall biosynthesis
LSANKVAACIITGDQYNEAEVKLLLKSLEPHVDGIFVNYNGTKGKLNWQKWTDLPLVYEKFKWEDDFALARNQSFSLVPKDEYDWLFWIDTDDVLVGEPGAMDELFESLDEYTEGVFLRYAYAVDPDTGIVVVEQWRERILSTKMEWNWVFPIHEVCRSVSNIQYAKRDQLYIEHQRKSGEDRGARDRNRRIIANAAAKYPEESRYQFYLAGETLAEADSEENPQRKAELIEVAIVAYEKFRSMANELSDDVYLATARLAELYRMKHDHANAIQTDLECIAIYPNWPDGYVGAAKSCMELGDWARMKGFADMAVKCEKPSTAASIEPLMAGFTPLFLRGMANEELGNIDQALDDYHAAQELWNPPNGQLDDKIAELEAYEGSKSSDDRWTKRKELRGTKPEKSIAFFTQPIPETWHPITLAQGGHGGAETSIMKLAPKFAADGWRVVVFGTPGEHRGVYEDVEYWNSDEYLPTEKFKVLVSSRSVIPFDTAPVSDISLLWMHDVNIGAEEKVVLDRPTKIVALTPWHATHLSKLYKQPLDRFAVLPHGTEPERFPLSDWDKSNPLRFIYSSSPDRGLDTLLSMWPIVKERYADAELHIFYGWEIIDKVIRSSQQRNPQVTWLEEFKNKCLGQIELLGGEEGGLYQHGRVNQDVLAQEMAKSSIWPYPTQFMETYCITALEMQMAGVTPVTSGLAALNDVIWPEYMKVTGWPQNSAYQAEWLNLMAAYIDQPDWQEWARKEAREFAEQMTWDAAYDQWNDLIIQLDQ